MNTRTGFTGELWASGSAIYEEILRHPFITGLTDGTLDGASFRFYVLEDSAYLEAFARTLSLAAAKAPRPEWIVAMNKDAIGSLEAEHSLHAGFFKDFGVTEQEVRSRPMAPTNLAYCNYLLSTGYSRPFGEILGSLLPCYWIYAEVGQALATKGSENPLFQRWIDTYGSESYESGVLAVLDVMDELVAFEGEESKKRIRNHYLTTARYEWMFFDMGYRQEAWPV